MKPLEAEQLVALIHAGFPNMTAEQRALYQRKLEPEDADLATKAILRGMNVWKYPPSWADLRELILAEKRGVPEAKETYRVSVMPMFVRRFVCARFLYTRFDREKDLRPFLEQFPMGPPPGIDLMPEDEWVEEAATVNIAEAWRAIRSTGGAA